MYCCPSDCDCSLLVCSCKVVTVGLFSWTNYLRRSECPAFVGLRRDIGPDLAPACELLSFSL